MQLTDFAAVYSNLGRLGLLLAAVGLVGCAADNGAVGPGGQTLGTTGGGDGGTASVVAQAGSAGSASVNNLAGSGGVATSGADTGGVGGMSGGGAGGMTGSEGGMSGAATAGGGAGGAGGAQTGGSVDAWYEAEAPENEIDNGTVRSTCGNTCATVADKASCCSGGGELRQLLGRGGTNNAGGGVTFKNVTVPSDGMYDVTWWYHCGLFDHWHDSNCGGAPYPAFYDAAANPQPGCRPHLITVNGVALDGPDHKTPFWQFPCFGGPWTVMHVATTPLFLKAGKNQIRLGAPHIADLDAVDIDAIHVVSAGKGTGPVVTEPRAIAGDGGRK